MLKVIVRTKNLTKGQFHLSSVVGISDSDLFLRHDKFAQPTKAVDFNRFNMTREVVHYETAGDDHDQSSRPDGVSAIIIFPWISLILPLDMRPWHARLWHRRRAKREDCVPGFGVRLL
ncbi:hypothetical protein DYB28_011569 [Aphanomyces astaci]|uniref:Uncharacterized protein n=1 Tax=Aphanomyces astaci TaxID=112090 RepID=A0A9X8HBZ8_APHAT|nr:hypothetical protein DYB28_011569 [Aphanomyces astaci]